MATVTRTFLNFVNNERFYRKHEFESWANRSGLTREESFLINTYLTQGGKTLEAGTGSGRILAEMDKLGFEKLWGFDLLPEFIAVARARKTTARIQFTAKDATRLDYPDRFFDQIIYLQQIISFVDTDRSKALREASRILAPGGVALFSFLCAEGSPAYRKCFECYISVLRKLSGSRRSPQLQPWLKRGGNWNWSAILDQPPHCYWYTVAEAIGGLREAGFHVTAYGTSHQLRMGALWHQKDDVASAAKNGMLYCVCTNSLPSQQN